MGIIKHYEGKEYVINSLNGKQYVIKEKDLYPFVESFNKEEETNQYTSKDLNEILNSILNYSNVGFYYTDASLLNKIPFSFRVSVNNGDGDISIEYLTNNIEEFHGKISDIYLINDEENFYYKIGELEIDKYYNKIKSRLIFDMNEFINSFSYYVLGMSDINGSKEEFTWG